MPERQAMTPASEALCLPLPAHRRPRWWELPPWWALTFHIALTLEVVGLITLGIDVVDAVSVAFVLVIALGKVAKSVAFVPTPWLTSLPEPPVYLARFRWAGPTPS